MKKGYKGKWQKISTALPGITVMFLPKLVCPACWPAYAGLLGILGLEFVNYTPWLMPLTLVALGFSLGVLAFRAKKRHGYGPFFLGLLASGVFSAGKFVLDEIPMVYGGAGILIVAFVWNAWPARKAIIKSSCPTCAGSGDKIVISD